MGEDAAAAAVRLRADRVPFVYATVVRAQAPTSSRPGDTALIHADGRVEGFVGGMCAESSVRLYSLQALANGQPLLLRILPDELPDGDQRHEADGTVTVGNPCLSGGAIEVFLEPHAPAPRMLVVGDTPIAHALADLGRPTGYLVQTCTGDDVATIAPSPDDAALVVASHGKGEIAALEAALAAGVPYVALVASRRRGAAVLADLAVDEATGARVHTPAGLDIGARTAAEVALSILAEIVSLRPRPQHDHAIAHHDGHDHPGPTGGINPTLTATDPICGMTVAAVRTSLHESGPDGETVYFCGEGCRAAYLAGQ